AFISGTAVQNNGVAGILSKNSTTNVTVTVTRSVAQGNAFGLAAQDFTNASVFESEFTGNSNTGLQSTITVGGTSTLEVYNSTVTHSTLGLFSGGGSTVWLSGLALFDNSTGITIAGGTVNTAHNNFNNTTGTPNGAASFVQ